MKNLIVLLLFSLFTFSISAKVLPYSEIDSTLEKVWLDTYPLPYTKLVKKDLLGKGIALVRKNGKNLYMYSFTVFMPRYTMEDGEPKALEEGRNIIVRLYHNYNSKEKPYFIDLGEFEEKYNRRLIIRYIPSK